MPARPPKPPLRRLAPSSSTLLALCILAAILLPVALAAWLAELDARNREREALALYAKRGLAQVEAVAANASQALRYLDESATVPCTPGWTDAAQRAVVKYRYVQIVLALDADGVTQCTSMAGDKPQHTSLGAAVWQNGGHRVWVNVPDPEGAGRQMVVIASAQNAVLIDPESLIDVVSDHASFSLGIIGLAHGNVVAAWPDVDRGALQSIFVHPDSLADDGQFHVQAASARLPLAVVASEPDETLMRRWFDSLKLWLPAGLLVGMMAAGGLIWLVRRRYSFESQLRDAIRQRQFEVHYQPIVSLTTRRCVGAEALVRWRQPDGQLVRPDLFIPLAESTSLVQPLTDLVLDIICNELGATLAAQPELYISINLAAQDLATDRFVHILAARLALGGIRPQQIAIEATERGFMHAEAACAVIQTLRNAGHPVFIDDFGTGYSGLAYLQTFAVDALKIDKSFVDTVGTDSATASVAPHIVEMGHALQLKLIAEGVETAAQADWLAARGVQCGQGWLFGRPMDAAGFLQLLGAGGG